MADHKPTGQELVEIRLECLRYAAQIAAGGCHGRPVELAKSMEEFVLGDIKGDIPEDGADHSQHEIKRSTKD